MKATPKVIAGIIVLDVILIFVFFFAPRVYRSGNIQELPQILRERMGDCSSGAGSGKCYQALARELVLDFQIRDITKTVVAEEGHPAVFAKCHELLHYVGREAFGTFGDVAEAFLAGDTSCFAGYYHGVLEGYLQKENPSLDDIASMENIARNTSSFCHNLKTRSLPLKKFNECLHGLGHAYMFITENELPAALKMCDVESSPNNSNWCYSGVFMENSSSSTENDHPTKYKKEDDPLFPCSILETRYLDSCYTLQGSYFLSLAGGDWASAVRLCEKIPDPYNLRCIGMIGQSQVNQLISASRMSINCLSLASSSYQEVCIEGTIGAMGERFEVDAVSRVVEFCGAFSGEKKDFCNQKLSQIAPNWR